MKDIAIFMPFPDIQLSVETLSNDDLIHSLESSIVVLGEIIEAPQPTGIRAYSLDDCVRIWRKNVAMLGVYAISAQLELHYKRKIETVFSVPSTPKYANLDLPFWFRVPRFFHFQQSYLKFYNPDFYKDKFQDTYETYKNAKGEVSLWYPPADYEFLIERLSTMKTKRRR